MCKTQGSFSNSNTALSSIQLHWDKIDAEIIPSSSYDVIIASDCLFFRDFHRALLQLLRHALKCNDNSMVVLLQPRRSGTMDEFIALAVEYFHVEVIEDYHPEV
jgi:calmodulin-lysine N-methyltransferase